MILVYKLEFIVNTDQCKNSNAIIIEMLSVEQENSSLFQCSIDCIGKLYIL